MKLELKQNMYIRTKDGIIGKLMGYMAFNENKIAIWTNTTEEGIKITPVIDKDAIIKASYNIIDLIKSKDIILGKDGKIYQCWKIYKDYVFTYSKNKQGQTITLVDYQIDKVLAKEQMEQMEQMAYKVGE